MQSHQCASRPSLSLREREREGSNERENERDRKRGSETVRKCLCVRVSE